MRPKLEGLLESLQKLTAEGKTDMTSLRKAFEQNRSPPKQKQKEKQKDVSGSVETILPAKGFAVKTADSSGQKVFINVCGHEKLPAPNDLASLQLPRLALSIGPLRKDSDHNGSVCQTVDCVFHDGLIKTAETDRGLKVHMIRTCLDWVQKKYDQTLDPQWKLPKLRYKGEIKSQVLSLVNLPGVQEVASSNAEQQVGAENLKDSSSQVQCENQEEAQKSFNLRSEKSSELPTLQHTLECQGHPVEAMALTIQGPKEFDAHEAQIKVAGLQLTVSSKSFEKLTIQMPFGVDARKATAVVNAEGALILKLPYRPLKDWWIESQGS